MFIELTDHLRCSADHAEQFLVLLPDRMEGRRVIRGDLGCPVCGKVVQVEEGIADFGDAPASDGKTALSADALAACFGLSGPGGYLALAGGLTSLGPDLAALLPGVRIVLVNPPAGTPDSDIGSVLRSARLPLKTGSMRGVAVGADLAHDQAWIADAMRVALPGLRVVVEGGQPPASGLEVIGSAEGVWVGRVGIRAATAE
jgi:hypothetical protein